MSGPVFLLLTFVAVVAILLIVGHIVQNPIVIDRAGQLYTTRCDICGKAIQSTDRDDVIDGLQQHRRAAHWGRR